MIQYEFERRTFAKDLFEFDKRWSPVIFKPAKSAEDDDGVTHEELNKFCGFMHVHHCCSQHTCRAFKTFADLTSGIGVHYAPSLIISTTHQALAKNLVIGLRILPQIAIRVADWQPIEIQDLCPADLRFKVIVFTGPAHGPHLDAISAELAREDGWLRRYGSEAVFDIITVCQGRKETISWMSVPQPLRPHWAKCAASLANASGSPSFAGLGVC